MATSTTTSRLSAGTGPPRSVMTVMPTCTRHHGHGQVLRGPLALDPAGQAVAVIRQRTRSDHDYPDIGHFPDTGQAITWQLWWQHTPMLVDDRAATASRTSPRSAARRRSRSPPGWQPVTGRRTRPGCPGSSRPTRRTPEDAASSEDLAGRLYGLLIRLDDRLPAEQAHGLHHVPTSMNTGWRWRTWPGCSPTARSPSPARSAATCWA